MTDTGASDPGFGFNGTYLAPVSLNRPSKMLNAINIDDETIFAIGYHLSVDNNTLFMVAIDDKGSINPNYFENGYTTIDINSQVYPEGFDMDGEFLYIVANDINNSSGQVYKIDLDSHKVNTCDDNGRYTLATQNNKSFTRIHKLKDGLIVTGMGDNDFTIWKLNSCLDVSTETISGYNSIHCYTNPSQDELHILLKDDTQVKDINIVNQNGQIVKSISGLDIYNVENIISISELIIGKYSIRIESKNHIEVSAFIKL